jgi:GNAT superfamily N-acetyltransferase
MAPQLRSATPEDAAGIASVSVGAWVVSYRGFVADEVLDTIVGQEPQHAEHWRGYRRFGDDVGTLVADDADGRILGYVSYGPSRDDDVPPGAYEVYALNVDPGAQRHGLGAALLSRAVEELEDHSPLTLWVLERNAGSRAFYESQGWRPDGSRSAIEVGGVRLPTVRYEHRGRDD